MPKKSMKKVDLVAAYKKVFSSVEGETVLFDLMKQGNFLHTSYNGNADDCIFNEGERNIVNYILTQLKQDPVELKKFIDRREQEELEYADF